MNNNSGSEELSSNSDFNNEGLAEASDSDSESSFAGSFSSSGSVSRADLHIAEVRKITRAQFKDRLKGMLLLGVYGDALGAPHELSGGALDRHQVGNPVSVERLQPFAEYNAGGANQWGVWGIPDGDKVGFPTDDSSYRVTILHEWLGELAEKDEIPVPTEDLFFKWLAAQLEPANNASQWKKSRFKQIKDWIGMREAATATPPRENIFFIPGTPAVFGAFLYLELAAIYADCDKEIVFDWFSNFTKFDQLYGKFVTGMMAVMLAEALCAPKTNEQSEDIPFDTWFFATVSNILDSDLGDQANRELVKAQFEHTKMVLEGIQGQELEDFVADLVTGVFRGTTPPHFSRDSNGRWNRTESFDPLVFIRMMTAAVGYSGGDAKKALQVLATSPGDADTMTTFLGSIVGAYYGEGELSMDMDFKMDFDNVSNCIKQEFGGTDISEIPDRLIAIAKRHGRFIEEESDE